MTTDGTEVSREDPPTDGPPRLPEPHGSPAGPNGLFAGPPDAPDQYELLGEGLRGGEGITWRARYRGDLQAPVPFAIKMLNRPRNAGPAWPTAAELRRWKDQTVLLQHLHLDHVVWLHEVFVGAPPHQRGEPGTEQRTVYLSMEWVDGPTLASLVDGTPASAATIAQRMHYVVEVAQALTSLHSTERSGGNPTLHRDIKPTNCIINPGRGVVLIDVSTMRPVHNGFDPDGLHTAEYTAPEVLRNPHRSRQASGDLYSLGALAVFCLLGTDPPPAGAAVGDLVAGRLVSVARQAGVADPDAFAAHILRMLRSDPASRPDDATTWARTLQRLASARSDAPAQTGPAVPTAGPTTTRRWRRTLTVVALTAALVAAGSIAGAAVFAPNLPWTASNRPTTGATTETTGSPSLGGTASPGNSPAPSTSDAGTASSSPGATSAVPTTVPTNRTAPTAAPPGGGAAAVTVSSGTIGSPGEGADVLQCSYFSGSARLASGKTLILAMRNLDNGDPNKYVEYVFGWRNPQSLSSWQGAQYFGQDGDEGGQRYRVELMAVDLAAAESARASGTAAENALAGQGSVLAARNVRRAPGTVANDCVGP